MINSVSEQQAYLNAVMEKLPDVEQKKEYALKSGDSLWSLAKKALNNEKSSNAETANYMLLIAKLNNLDTVEKMNSLKIGQKIYLPGEKVDLNKKQPPRTDAESTFLEAIKTLQTDKTLVLEKAKLQFGQCYHLYRQKKKSENYFLNKKLMLSFDMDSKGEIKNVSMDNSKKDLYSFGYDYHADQNGNIVGARYPHNKEGKLSKEENTTLRKSLMGLVNNYNKE